MLEELLQEDLRLFYVALTRARNHCAISWGALSKFSNSSPHWLLAPASEENSALRAAADNLCDRSEGSIRLQAANDTDPVVRPRAETGGALAGPGADAGHAAAAANAAGADARQRIDGGAASPG